MKWVVELSLLHLFQSSPVRFQRGKYMYVYVERSYHPLIIDRQLLHTTDYQKIIIIAVTVLFISLYDTPILIHLCM
mgnify:FL=1